MLVVDHCTERLGEFRDGVWVEVEETPFTFRTDDEGEGGASEGTVHRFQC